MFSVYILESETGQWYYGSSEKLEQRLKDHNSNRAKFTRFKGPWTLIFKRDFQDKSECLKFEKELKGLKNKKYIRTAYATYFLETN